MSNLNRQSTMAQAPGALAKALYTNSPDAPNELMFRKGDILTLLDYDYDGQPGWWLCALRGQRGICPSNYLILLEDNYPSLHGNRTQVQRSLSHACETTESVVRRKQDVDACDAFETYDIPRSCVKSLSKSSSQLPEPALYSNQPLYQNEQELIQKDPNPQEVYDIPRSHLPIYGQSLTRLRRYGQVDHTTGSTIKRLGRSSSVNDLGLPPSGNKRNDSNRNSPDNLPQVKESSPNNKTISETSGLAQVEFRNPPPRPKNHRISIYGNIPINHSSNRFSIQSESAESGIVMVSSLENQELYDVPRSNFAAQLEGNEIRASNGHTTSGPSRPQSVLSASSSGMGLSIANSDSKDSLDFYDVPRCVKAYVNHIEAKYDQVSVQSENCSGVSRDSTLQRSCSRHNSTSSIFSAYGYTRQGANSLSESRASSVTMHPSVDCRSSIQSFHNQPSADFYDVPKGSVPAINFKTDRPTTAASSTSLAASTSQASLVADDMTYDIPPAFARRVSLRDSSETLSVVSEEGGNNPCASSSSSKCNPKNQHHNGPPSTITSFNKFPSAGAAGSSEIKLLPLGPKAAVSVCEKLRHEVVTSITSILGYVKPKWRSKENLTTIMPDLRFSCTRLSLAIKDVAEFATRALSNAKQAGDEALVTRLHRILTPVVNGSQIMQRDVDELEGYFWSVDRLSVVSGNQSARNVSGDALDQLVLCAKSLKHDVTEIANFLALNSSVLFREPPISTKEEQPTNKVAPKTKEAQEDYDYVSLVSDPDSEKPGPSSSCSLNLDPVPSVPLQLDSRDEQLLEFYSAQIGVTAPLLSQSISTFISAIHQNEPPERFNIHLKYVILLAYRLLFAGDTVHRNLNNVQLKMEVESKANDLHKSILALYEANKVATLEFPKIAPMQNIVDKVWSTTKSATQLKKVIFNATCAAL